MNVHVCTGLWAGTCMVWVDTHVYVQSEVSFSCRFSEATHLVFLRQGVSLGRGIRLGEASEQVGDVPVSAFPSAGMTCA